MDQVNPLQPSESKVISQNLETPFERISLDEPIQVKHISTVVDVPFLETPSIDLEIVHSYPNKNPSTFHMVFDAIRQRSSEGGRRSGASLQSIKQHIKSSFMVDIGKRNHLIKQCLVNGVARGQIVQLSGHGANGSFRMPNKNKKKKKAVKTKKIGKVTKTMKKKSTTRSSRLVLKSRRNAIVDVKQRSI